MRSRVMLLSVMTALAASAAFAAEPEGSAVEADPEASAQPSASTDSQPARRAARASADRLELETTVVTGNRELPKVLYIVPWKKAELGDLPGQPFNTLLDEVLTPVDRDVFRREVTYFEALTESADATQSTSRPRQ
jgi:hypothetical protein